MHLHPQLVPAAAVWAWVVGVLVAGCVGDPLAAPSILDPRHFRAQQGETPQWHRGVDKGVVEDFELRLELGVKYLPKLLILYIG